MTAERLADVAIAGGGPAGAVAALNLARLHRVAVVDPDVAPTPRIGESLPPASRRLLAAMGLWERFAAARHAPCHGNRATWGSTEPREVDFLRDPDGHGWHLDRARFDAWLRAEAAARGAELVAARAIAVEPVAVGWRLALDDGTTVRARALIDATGRRARVARKLGARRTLDDRLVCGWLHGRDRATDGGWTELAAEPDGWWYTAPLPDGRRVLAFHTDADLPAARDARDPARLLARAETVGFAGLVSRDAGAADAHGFVAAHGGELTPAAGESRTNARATGVWCAVGDAALAFDPLSSQGLHNALFTGLAGAEAVDRWLGGARSAIRAAGLADYLRVLAGVRAAYVAHRARWYAEETRWPDRPFWSRRRAP